MEMKKITIMIGTIIGAVVIIVIAIILSGWSVGPSPVDATISSLEDMQVDPPADYFRYLSGVIRSHPDPYVRQRAVFTLTDISIRKEESASVRTILLEIARDSPDSDLRSAAFSNLNLIDSAVPQPPKAEMNITVEGEILVGRTIAVNVHLTTSVQPEKAVVGITRVPEGLELESDPVVRTTVGPGKEAAVPFSIRIVREGEYELPFSSVISYSRVEKEEPEKTLYLVVKKGAAGNTEII